jgi:hypothetical protein
MMEPTALSIGEATAPIVRRAANMALRDPRWTADALFFLSDALDELAGHIAVTAAGPQTESTKLAALAERARAVAVSRITP